MASTSPPAEFQTVTIFVNPFLENMTSTMNFSFEVMIDAFEMFDFVMAFSDNYGISFVAYTVLVADLDSVYNKRIDSPTIFALMGVIFSYKIGAAKLNVLLEFGTNFTTMKLETRP